jgi:hypothetical protein
MTLWQRWKQTALHNKALVWASLIMALGTIFYAGAAIWQVYLMKQNAIDSASQFDRLTQATDDAIKKAVDANSKSIADAITQNKASLDDALRQNREALKDSERQSRAVLDSSERQSKAALDASIAASRNDQRAWIGISATTTETGSLNPPNAVIRGLLFSFSPLNEPSFSFKSVDISLHNSGKTPAVRIESECCLVLHRSVRIDEIPEYDGVRKEIDDMQRTRTRPTNGDIVQQLSNNQSVQFASHGGTLPPDVTRPETILDGGMRWGVTINGLPSIDYVLGKTTYHDVFPDSPAHTTTICLVRKAQDRFVICSGGGTMD